MERCSVVDGQVCPAEHCQPGGPPLEHTGQVPPTEVCRYHPGKDTGGSGSKLIANTEPDPTVLPTVLLRRKNLKQLTNLIFT